MCEPQRLHYFKVPRTGARRYLSPTPVGVGVATWAVDQTLYRLPRESRYARLGKYIGSTCPPLRPFARACAFTEYGLVHEGGGVRSVYCFQVEAPRLYSKF